MENQTREKALLEVLRQGLFVSAQRNDGLLGERSKYVGLSEIAKYAECPRAAVSAKLENVYPNFQSLLATQRGHWFEAGLKQALHSAGLMSIHQLEINIRKKFGVIKAHLDFTLVWDRPIQAVRILEIKSTGNIPQEPREQHMTQVQGQIDLLRYYWNKPVFTIKNEKAEIVLENRTFPEICRDYLNLEISTNPRKVSLESWLLYISMQEIRASGPYTFDPVKLDQIFESASSFYDDLRACKNELSKINELPYPKGFYPLCSWCDFNSDCPKFKQGQYQPQWEAAINKLQELKNKQDTIHQEITEIEDALKQAHKLSETKDWIDTGGHRFRMSMIAGRKSLNQDSLKSSLSGIFQQLQANVDVDDLFANSMKQGSSFPRLTISNIN